MLKAIHPSFPPLFSALALFWLLSCSPPKNLAYFQTLPRDTVLQNTVSKNFEIKIAPDDVLAITIASSSPELSGLFNASASGGITAGSGTPSGYLVDKKGNIQLYKLGNVKVSGLTREELQEKLEKDLSPYLKEPVVTVRFVNHKVVVLGEVGSPGVLPLAGEQVSLIEALGEKGDLTENARRDNILVIRQTAAGKEFRRLNLLDHSVFSSPYFYLQNEDVVYVEPEVKKNEPKVQQTVSYIITGISLLTLIISRIR